MIERRLSTRFRNGRVCYASPRTKGAKFWSSCKHCDRTILRFPGAGPAQAGGIWAHPVISRNEVVGWGETCYTGRP